MAEGGTGGKAVQAWDYLLLIFVILSLELAAPGPGCDASLDCGGDSTCAARFCDTAGRRGGIC